MKKVKITAPNKEFTGKRGGVGFVDGAGETDDPAMVAYFRRHGYGIDGEEPAEPEPSKDEPTPGLKEDGDAADKGDDKPAPKRTRSTTKKASTKPTKPAK